MSKKQKTIFFSVITVLVILLIGFNVWYFHQQLTTLLGQFTNRQELIARFQAHEPFDMITFTLLLILCTWLPGAPVAIFAIVAGICFGHWTALALNAIAITIGNFSVADLLPEIWHAPERHTTGKLYQDLLKIRHPAVGILLGYAIPFIPSTVINLAAKRLIHNRPKLALLCFLGSLPTSTLYAFGGDAVLHGNVKRLLIIVVIALLLFGLGRVIHYDRHRESAASRH